MAALTRRLLIECGAAETRAAFLVGDEATQFWFGPARGDEGLPAPPQTGDMFAGRVKSVSKALGGAFADIGAERDGFLPFRKNEKPPHEGAIIFVEVRRPPIGDKGAVLSALGADDMPADVREAVAQRTIGRLGGNKDAVLQAIAALSASKAAYEIIIDGGAVRAMLEEATNAPVEICADPFGKYAVDEAITESLSAESRLRGGGRLLILETEAGALFDVDAAEAAGRASASMNDKTNKEAVERIFLELVRRNTGGRVIVDFLPPSGAEARGKLADNVKNRLKAISKARFGRLHADGLCDLTLPRTSLTLLEQSSEPAGDGWPVTGRRFTLDWSAKAAIRALERVLSRRPSSRPRLIVGTEIAAYISQRRPQWSERLQQKFGARFVIENLASMEMRHHELVE